MKLSRAVLACCSLLPAASTSSARPLGPPQGSAEDFRRAATLGERLRDAVAGAELEHGWSADGTRLWFTRRAADGARAWFVVELETGAIVPAFDAGSLAAALGAELGTTVDPERLPIEALAVDGGGELRFLLAGDSPREGRFEEGRVLLSEPAAPSPFVVPLVPDAGEPPSSASWARGTLVVVNRRAGAIRLAAERGGFRRSGLEVPAGATRRESTRNGTRWRVTDAGDGTALGVIVARAGVAVAYVDDAAPGAPPSDAPEERSPGPRVSFREHDAWLARPDGSELRLTDDGREGLEHRGPVTFGPTPEAGGAGHVLFFRGQRAPRRQVSLVESAPRDQLQPKLHTFDYDKPGDERDRVLPLLFRTDTGAQVPIDAALFPDPYDLTRFSFSADGVRLYFVDNERGHRVARLIEVDLEAGATRVLIDERPATFFDYANKLFVRHLESSDEVLWTSERSGWNHLWRVDRKGGRAHAVTSGEWVVRAVESVDEEARTALLRVRGRRPGEDPYHDHYARVELDGGALTPLTEGNGTHRIELSPDGRFLLDTWSRADQPPVHELRRAADGGLVAELARADASRAQAILARFPEPFVAKGRDGATDIWGLVYRPSSFDPAARLPVIEAIYAGPQDAHVPKSFEPFREPQRLAELGFVVVQIDGMGTNWRSKAFHDVAWHDLADAGFPDRIAWLRAAAERYPELDLDRVGIYGGSAGGQNALRAVLDHHDFYRAAAADCGCHDNRMDKLWWNELWMSYPVDESYAASSNVEHAARLGGALLLTVGELDRNVDPASTMQVVDALIRADKDFELVVFPGAGHGAGESPYGKRRRDEFFVRELWGLEPRWTGEPATTVHRQHNGR